MKTLLVLLVALAATLSAQGQFGQAHICGTDHHYEQQVRQNPALLQHHEALEAKVANYRPSAQRSEDTFVIPVVVHVLHQYGSENISKAQIESALAGLNRNFRNLHPALYTTTSPYKNVSGDMKVVFRLATKDPNGQCTDGIVRIPTEQTNEADDASKAISYWDSRKYFNIWVVRTINNFTGMSGTILGYAQFPWSGAASTDGIMMRSDRMNSADGTLTHEAGHWLGLLHTFQGGCSNSDCTTRGDRVCDTPPASEANYGCPTNKKSCTGNPGFDMIENYMDYSNCPFMFTKGQVDRAMGWLHQSPRSGLFTLSNLMATGVLEPATACVPRADFFVPNTVVCVGEVLDVIDYSYNAPATNYVWQVSGPTSGQFEGAKPAIVFTQPGTYTITLIVGNESGSDQAVRQNIVTVLPEKGDVKLPFAESFDNTFVLDESWQTNEDNNAIAWATRDHNGTDRAMYLNNGNGEFNYVYIATMPTLDFSHSNGQISLDIAFKRNTSANTDRLQISTSTDCGRTWQWRWMFTATQMSANPGNFASGTSFVPAAEDWKTLTANIPALEGEKNVKLRFEFTNRGGNDIYIDNLQLGDQTASVAEVASAGGVSIYPVPATSEINIVPGSAAGMGTITVVDLQGKVLSSFPRVALQPGSPITLNRAQMNINAPGVYIVRIVGENGTWTRRIVMGG